MKILVTGGAGFIGSNFIRWMLQSGQAGDVVNLDKLTYAGNPENLKDLNGKPGYRFLHGDVADPRAVEEGLKDVDAVVHFAAETHVDRSIRDAGEFLRTNVEGTRVLLEASLKKGIRKFIHISTDEVYGSLPEGAASEESPMRPNSPYAASKAGADHLVRAYHVTYGLFTVTLRASNNYGPYQFPEKFIPLLITNALEDEPLPIYGDGLYIREWLFVEDFCRAISLVMDRGEPGQAYNVGSGEHRVNLDVVEALLDKLEKPRTLVRHVQDRPGHDRRYSVDSAKIRKLGWKPQRTFEQGLDATVRWYRDHSDWWRPLRPGSAPARFKRS